MINGVLGAEVWGESEMPMLPNCFSRSRRLRYRELLSECVHALLDCGGYRRLNYLHSPSLSLYRNGGVRDRVRGNRIADLLTQV